MEIKHGKLAEMMLHIAIKERNNRTFGATKLNKILFYSDFYWYQRTGQFLTGATYRKRDHGPAAHELLPTQQALVRHEAAHVEIRRLPFGTQKRLVPDREPNLAPHFEPEEVEFVDEVIEWLSDVSATKASNITHGFLGWRLAEYDEEIPYFTSLFSEAGVAMPSDIKRGLELAKELGWSKESSLSA